MPQEPSPQQISEKKIYRQMGLIPDEYKRIVELLGSQTNYTETGIFAVMWSEHCSYKNSKSLLKFFPTEGPNVLKCPGEGAVIVLEWLRSSDWKQRLGSTDVRAMIGEQCCKLS